jgi:pimeloyl-ACP methyl ester carboxylesterase
MRAHFQPATPGELAPTRIALLPAAYAAPEHFLRAGFARAVRSAALPIDLELVELSLPQITDRTVLRRLRHEIVLPARAQGVQSLWLCGISLGGFLALAYTERYPTEIDGLCLLAPYLGNRMVTGEIERAGGLAAWQPGELAADDDERRVWRFIQSRAASQSACPPLHLGFGREDRFAAAHELMASVLPPQAVDRVSGGHDWPVWRTLWENFLAARLSHHPGLASSSA